MIIQSAVAAAVPMLIYLMLIWKFDMYDREPVLLVVRNFLWGALGAIFFSLIGSYILSFLVSVFVDDKLTLQHIETIAIAPFVEETTKGLFILLTISSRKFDNMTDGIVYGGAIGLGFGMTENFIYFITYQSAAASWISMVVVRTLFSGTMHCVATATFGAFLGYAKFKNIFYKMTFPFLGLGAAMFIHFMWNYSITFENTELLGFIFMTVTILIFIIVFSISLQNERKIIYRELLEEAENGIIPMSHVAILNSPVRNKFGWIDEKVRKTYIQSATTLAFRKMQLRNTKGSNRTYYENDVLQYRNYIQSLLAEPE